MADTSSKRISVSTAIVFVVVLLAAVGVGGYAFHAYETRQAQLKSDEMGRQRDADANHARLAKLNAMGVTAPAAAAATRPAPMP